AHHDAVLECEARADHAREHLNEARTDALVDLERERNDCLVEADDAAREPIEAMLAAAGDSWTGQTTAVWDAQRTTATSLCNLLVESNAESVADRRPVVAATCNTTAELHFAALLDAYVDFGEVPFSILAARDRYPSCYAAYDDAQADAPGTDPLAEVVAIEEQLAACIADVHEDLAVELAARVVELFPERDPATVEQDLIDALAGQIDARAKVCIVAAHAGTQRASDDVDQERAECLVDVAIQAGDLVVLVAPDLLDETPVDDGTSDDTSDDAGTSDDGGTTSADDGTSSG
ncbi:MAG TPA: hypothetical protein VFG69_09610, partial [Nannocystaceae bacterium]|nr:hypothetical protein [Nannocystaceae bacterium]